MGAEFFLNKYWLIESLVKGRLKKLKTGLTGINLRLD